MEIIVAICGLAVSAAAFCLLIKFVMLKKNGVATEAEVISADRVPGRKTVEYTHMLRFELDGKTVEYRLKTAFTQPFSVGRKMNIYVDKKNPDFIKLADRMNYNMSMLTVTVVTGLLVAVRFFLLAS